MLTLITESTLTPQQTDIWMKAKQAVSGNNAGYAVSLLKALVKNCPGFLEGRELLRACEIQLNPKPKKAGLFGGFKLSSGGAGKDPLATLSQVEDELEKDPFNEGANEKLFHAGMALGNLDIAAFGLETVRKGHPENIKLMILLADTYMSNDLAERAVDVYHTILLQDPNNSEAVKGEKDAAARASMKAQHWDEAKSFRDVMNKSASTADLDKGDKQGMTRQEMEERLARLSAKYAQNQTDLFTVRDIANVYEQMEDWDNAYSFYAYAYSLSNNDMSLNDKASHAKTRSLEMKLTNLKKAVAEDPNNAELKAQLDEYTHQVNTEAVEEAKRRVDANPTDPQLRFDLGQALYNAGEYTEAIPHLQRARNNPHIRTKAMLLLGKCYDSKDMSDMALSQLVEANEELHGMDATKKEILYLIGSINDKLGKSQEALDAFKLIYDADYGYLDVASRVENSYKK